MDAFDFLGEQVVMTPAGNVAVSLASHDDGAVSVVAWLMETGRRVGYLYCRPRQRQPQESMIDALVDGTVVWPVMERLLDSAQGHRPATVPIGQRLVQAGAMTTDQLSDLLGWQWLLFEIGQPCELGELAIHAGLIESDAVDLCDGVIERHAPAPRRHAAAPLPAIDDLVSAPA